MSIAEIVQVAKPGVSHLYSVLVLTLIGLVFW